MKSHLVPFPGVQAFLRQQPAASRPQSVRKSVQIPAAQLLHQAGEPPDPLQQRFDSLVKKGHSQQNIAALLNLSHTEQQELTQQLIAREFICPQHMQAISRASQHHKFLVSFRAAGPATLEKLQAGAAAKGHDILEKTIKPSKLAEYYANPDEVFNQLKQAGLTGYVGHWDQHGLAGIYVTDAESDTGHRIMPLSLGNLTLSMTRLQEQMPDWPQRAFTGDYDMHDMISFHAGSGGPFTPLPGSREEGRIKDAINSEIAHSDPARPFEDTEHNLIRHGPQVNFMSYMKSHERRASRDGVEGSVARPGPFPLAVMNRGEWTLVSSLEELAQTYQQQHARMKEAWKPDGLVAYVHNDSTSGDKVVFGRRASTLSSRTSSISEEPLSPLDTRRTSFSDFKANLQRSHSQLIRRNTPSIMEEPQPDIAPRRPTQPETPIRLRTSIFQPRDKGKNDSD